MRIFLLLLLSGFCREISGQSPGDSVWINLKKTADSIRKASTDSFVTPKTVAVIISGSEPEVRRDNSTWENRWQNYIDQECLKIAEKILLRDSTKRVYKVMIEFSVNEDETLKDLAISSNPRNEFVEIECRQMVLHAPKRTAVYKNGKYVRLHIKQPVEIRIKERPQ